MKSHPHPPSTPTPGSFPGPFEAESSGADGAPGAWSAHQVIEVVGRWWRSRCVLEYGKTMGKSMGKSMETMEKNKGQHAPTQFLQERTGEVFGGVLDCFGMFWKWNVQEKTLEFEQLLIQSNNDATKTSPICGPNPHLFYNSQSFPSILHSLKKSII